MRWLNDVPVERKLRLAMLITSTLALLLACGIFIAVEYVGHRRNLADMVKTLARVTANHSTAALAFSDKAAAQQALEALRTEPQIVTAAFYDQDGGVFAVYPENKDVLPPRLDPAVRAEVIFSRGHLDATHPVVEDGRRLGTLYIRVTLDQMYERMRVYGIVVVSAIAAAFLAAWPVAWSLQRTISRPILELARTASAVASGPDYSIRARQYGRDELGQLTVAFNAMLERTEAAVGKVAQARDDAVAASRAKDEFLAALSHELRTPLNPVLMLASDAAGNPQLPAAVREDFARIAKHVTLEARLIDDLLDLTRITRGKLSLDLRECDARTVLRDAIATVQPDIDLKRQELRCEFGAEPRIVNADAVRLQQVFWNVLKNAVKFTPVEGSITVAVAGKDGGKSVEIRVADTGIGMTGAEIARAFEAFSQGEHGDGRGSHRFGGLGLGLAITRTLVEMHGGRIAAGSDGRDRGAYFVIELPLSPTAHRELGEVPPPPPRAYPSFGDEGVGKGRPRATVLVVEDHAATRTTLAHLLKRRNFEVVPAATLEEARREVAVRDFDLVVSDIGLPDGSGCTLMTELRARRPGQPGIALSGYGMEEDVARSQAAGFDAHLTKPIDVKALDDVIARLLPRDA